MNKALKKHIGLIIIIAIFLFAFYYNFNPKADLWWDSSVYIGMGKYIYSVGSIGLWEASRTLVWPLLLGFFWKLGFDVIFLGKILVLMFGIGTIVMTYIIAYELFDKKVALLSSFLLAFSPTFFFFNSILFTEIPSGFFTLLGIYFFIKKRYNLAGLVFGIAFMARFFQMFIIAPIYLFFLFLIYKKKAMIKQFLISILFFIIPVLPYLSLNFIIYKNSFYPFLLQAWMTEFTGLVYNQHFSFYFINLIKENFLVLFSILGIFFIFKKENHAKLIVPLVFLLAFLPYNFEAHKEMRFLISIMPFLYILTAYGMFKFSFYFGNKKTSVSDRCFFINWVLLLIIVAGVLQVLPQLRLNNYDDKLDSFYTFIQNNKVNDGLWISNPSFIAFEDVKADELIYYPLYNSNKIRNLEGKISKAKYILINNCDLLPCPLNDGTCEEEHRNFMGILQKKFRINLHEKHGNCDYYIFTSPGLLQN